MRDWQTPMVTQELDGSDAPDYGIQCGECGQRYTGTPIYCPSCGESQ